MPVASFKPTSPPIKPTEIDKENLTQSREIYKTATVDNAIIAPESLLVYMDGMPWTVDYYSQVLNQNDDLREIDIGQNASHQSYRSIKNLELRVQSELSSEYDSEKALTTVVGTSIIVQVTPNVYDYFITDTGNCEKSLFMVTGISQKTYNTKTVYSIDYILVGYIDANDTKDRYEALTARTVQTFFFNKDRITEGLSPLLTESDHEAALGLRYFLLTMYQEYFAYFWSSASRLILVPDEDETVYDPRLANFVKSLIDSRDFPSMQHVNTVSVDREPYLSKVSLWDALLTQQRHLLSATLNRVGTVSRSHFKGGSWLTSTNCWSVDRYIYPNFGNDNNAALACSLRSHPKFDPSQVFTVLPERGEAESVLSNPLNMYATPTGNIPFIKPVHTNDYYVFSEDFYKNTSSLSLLEILVRDYLDNKTISMQQIILLTKQWSVWLPLEKFYYGPVLILLIKDVIRGFY